MPESPSGRTRTPPDLKWLLNERAALAGAVASVAAAKPALMRRISKVELGLQRLKGLLVDLEAVAADKEATIAALDRTICLVHSDVNPTAAGVVKAWAGRYGRRGALKAFVIKKLQEVAPGALATTELVNLAIPEFGLSVEFSNDREKLRFPVRNILRRLAKDGQVDALHDPAKTTSGSWRWVGDHVPTLSDLLAQAAAVSEGSFNDNHAEPRAVARPTDSNPS
jgi:hypothetical protein